MDREAHDDPVVVTWPRDGVALVTLRRPHHLNALTLGMVDQVTATLHELGHHEDCRVIVMTGAGRGFCAGLDITDYLGRGTRDPSSSERLDSQERFAAMVRAVRAARQPVIAAVNGPAAGAGLGLALSADILLASASARFLVAAIRIGLSAGECGISYHLPRRVGASRAFEIMLTGRPVDADEAGRIGLVARVVPDEDLIPEALSVAEAICSNSPFGVEMTKQVAWTNLASSFDQAIELENRTQVLAVQTRDATEAMVAFTEKRRPNFTGA